MKIENILLSGKILKDMERIIREKGIKKQFRYVSEEDLTTEDFKWADAFVGFRPTPKFDLASVKWVHALGAGVDSFLFNQRWKEDVLLTRTICSFGNRISEYCLSYLLRDLQAHKSFESAQQQKRWDEHEPGLLASQTVVIFGTGVIGQEIARTLSFFGVKVVGVSRTGKEVSYFQQVVSLRELAQILPSADWVITTLPLTQDTYHYFSHSFFSHLRQAGFINVGRGKTVDDAALMEALENGHVRHAVLDVFTNEPLPEQSPFWMHPCVTITPHISAVTSPEEAVDCFLETLSRLEKEEPLLNRVMTQAGY